MRLVPLGIFDVYKKEKITDSQHTYVMRYDNRRLETFNSPLGHGFYLYTAIRIPICFEELFIINFPVIKESVDND